MNNLTPRAQQVLALARKEADRFNHNYVGTEHILLGLIKLGQGVAVSVLQNMGLDLETVRIEVEKQDGLVPEHTNPPHANWVKKAFNIANKDGDLSYTKGVKKVLSLSNKEAEQLDHSYVGTEHILLGLLREGEGVAARVLTSLNVDINQTRQEILAEIDPNFNPDDLGDEFEDFEGEDFEGEDFEGKAVYWYRKAAEQGHADAQNSLGEMYAKGLGVGEDQAEALYWYRMAAEQGHADAQNNLGQMYQHGEGGSSSS